MKSVMKSALIAVALVIALGTMACADTIINFESSEGYNLGAVSGQNGWTDIMSGSGQVIDTDASQGSQSLALLNGSSFGPGRSLNDTYVAGQTAYFKVDVKGTEGYAQLYKPGSFTARAFEFGFETGVGFYAFGGGVYNVEASAPVTNDWVTIWGKIYDAGSGNVTADLGWCELNQTPFVDGLRIAAYDAKDYDIGNLVLIGNGGFDQLRVSSTIPEPSTLALLTAGVLSLLAYAWRKRK
jgi:hypothetical protein